MTTTVDIASFVQQVQALALCTTRRQLLDVLKSGARSLVGADGVTVIFKDGDHCFYAAEDAMAPLFAPGRFAAETCISGWVMEHASSVVVPDVYADPRIPIALYQPTFVKSLGMVPIRSKDPIGALGFYWAQPYVMSQPELETAQALADAAATAISIIAHQENLEERVRERTELLTLSNRDLQLFAGNVAHDLRSPLAVLLANSQMLLDGSASLAEQRELLADIHATTRHMSQMLSGLLELSMVTSAPITRAPLDLSELASDVVKTLRGTARDRPVEVEIAPKLEAVGDERLMRIALGNLLNNAWKYTSKRERAVIRFARAQTDVGPAFVVQDNGAGFDSVGRPVFTAFKRFHSAAEFPGTGLGLTTVYRAIHRHGGAVWVESKPNAGAKFFFQIPTTA